MKAPARFCPPRFRVYDKVIGLAGKPKRAPCAYAEALSFAVIVFRRYRYLAVIMYQVILDAVDCYNLNDVRSVTGEVRVVNSHIVIADPREHGHKPLWPHAVGNAANFIRHIKTFCVIPRVESATSDCSSVTAGTCIC